MGYSRRREGEGKGVDPRGSLVHGTRHVRRKGRAGHYVYVCVLCDKRRTGEPANNERHERSAPSHQSLSPETGSNICICLAPGARRFNQRSRANPRLLCTGTWEGGLTGGVTLGGCGRGRVYQIRSAPAFCVLRSLLSVFCVLLSAFCVLRWCCWAEWYLPWYVPSVTMGAHGFGEGDRGTRGGEGKRAKDPMQPAPKKRDISRCEAFSLPPMVPRSHRLLCPLFPCVCVCVPLSVCCA